MSTTSSAPFRPRFAESRFAMLLVGAAACGGDGHHLGTMTNASGQIAGVAHTPGRSAFPIPDASVIAAMTAAAQEGADPPR